MHWYEVIPLALEVLLSLILIFYFIGILNRRKVKKSSIKYNQPVARKLFDVPARTPVSVASSNNKQPKADMSVMNRTYEPPAPVQSAVVRPAMRSNYSPPASPFRNKGSLELLIKYTSHGQRIERRISVHGLGKYKDCHYIIAHCHQANATRHFKLQTFRNCIDLGTGEVISKVKDYILAYNPVIVDLTDEFNALSEHRDK